MLDPWTEALWRRVSDLPICACDHCGIGTEPMFLTSLPDTACCQVKPAVAVGPHNDGKLTV